MTDWWCIHTKKSGQNSENTDIGFSEYGQKYFGVGRPELGCHKFALKILKLQINVQYFSRLNFSFGSWPCCKCISLVEVLIQRLENTFFKVRVDQCQQNGRHFPTVSAFFLSLFFFFFFFYTHFNITLARAVPLIFHKGINIDFTRISVLLQQ